MSRRNEKFVGMDSMKMDIVVDMYYDTDVAQMEFEENFEMLERGGRGRGDGTYLYTNGGEYDEYDAVEVDLKDSNLEGFQKLAIYLDYYNDIEENLKSDGDWGDISEVYNFVEDSWVDVGIIEKIELLDEYGLLKNDVEVQQVSSSQSDWITIIAVKQTEKEWKYIKSLYQDTPINGTITIDGEEYYVDEMLLDRSYFNTDDVIRYMKRVGYIGQELAQIEDAVEDAEVE